MTPSNADIQKKIQANAPIFRSARRSDISMQIRCKMIEKGLKNVDIASRLNVSEANVSRWLRGNQNLGIDTIYQLADALEEPLHIVIGNIAAVAQEEDHPLNRRSEYDFEMINDSSIGGSSIPDEGASNCSNVVDISVFKKMREQAPNVEPRIFSAARSESGVGEYEDLMVRS